MRILSILSVVLGGVAVAAAAFTFLHTYPRYDAARWKYEKVSAERDRAGRDRLLETEYDLAFDEYRDLEETLKMQILFGMWIAGGLAIVLGTIAAAKKRRIGLVGVLLGLAAVVVSFLTQPAHW